MVGSDLISSTARVRNEVESAALGESTLALYVRDGCNFREADDEAIVVRAQELVARQFRRGLPVLTQPQAVRSYLKLHMGPLKQTRFAALFLDRRKRLLAYHPLFTGTVDAVHVHPREIVRDALACNATGVILVRNEPSGEVEFSDLDALTWKRVSEALALTDIVAVDFILVGSRVVSGVEEGWIEMQS